MASDHDHIIARHSGHFLCGDRVRCCRVAASRIKKYTRFTLISDKIASENDEMALSAEDQARAWFEAQIPFKNSWIPRLLFVFEVLTLALYVRKNRQDGLPPFQGFPSQVPGLTMPVAEDSYWTANDEPEVSRWKATMDWWSGKCSYCAGQGLSGSDILHRLRECSRDLTTSHRVTMTASNLQSEPCSAIYPYVLLSTYRLLVCQVCAFASVADEVATYLRTRHRDIQSERRQELVEKIKQIPNILHSRDDLRHYLQYPTDTIQPIPYLAPPKPDGLKCRACGHIVRRAQKIQKHCTEKHQWINPRGRGRPAPNCPVSAYELPWEEHVACQRFFPSREGSKWFQVNMRIKEQANTPGAKPSAKKPQGTLQALTSEASIHLQQVIERDTQYREALNRTQWPSIYRGSRRDVLRALTRLPNRHSLDNDYIVGQDTLDGAQDLISPRKDERKVSFIMKALDSVINRCEDMIRATSHNLLCWLLSSRLQSRREFGFKLVAERSSEIRYRRTQRQFLAFVLRIYRMPDDSRREMVNVKMKPILAARRIQV
ncbi:hypothetical protein BKA60DRAFT_545465 [Fusarium oxysporum]|nr:hypothetical protein BKA60DRAFT_545465 [Fusarium oxysporum]